MSIFANCEDVNSGWRSSNSMTTHWSAPLKTGYVMTPFLPLPVLDFIDVAAPCPVSWAEMTGDDRVRHCSICQQSVYNLSALTRDAAEDLVRRTEGRLCVRFFCREDGTVMTRDCPVGHLRAVRRQIAVAVSVAAVLLLTIVGWVFGRPGGRERVRDVVDRAREVEPVRRVLDWIDPPRPVIMGALPLPPGTNGVCEDPDDDEEPPAK